MSDIARFSNSPTAPQATPSASSAGTPSVDSLFSEIVSLLPVGLDTSNSSPFGHRFTDAPGGSSDLQGSGDAVDLAESFINDLAKSLGLDSHSRASTSNTFGAAQSTGLGSLTQNPGNANPVQEETNDGGEIAWGIDAQTDGSSLAGDTTPLGNLEVGNAGLEPGVDNGDVSKYTSLSQDPAMPSQGSELFSAAGPAPWDVFQGTNGDCYLLASAMAVAQANPSQLANNIKSTGNGTYAVTMYYQGKPETVKVDDKVPTDSSGNPIYAQIATDPANGKAILWPMLLEKAFAKFADQHPDVIDSTAEGYNALNGGGYGSEALAALTGQPVYTNSPQQMDSATLQRVLGAGSQGVNSVTLGTNSSSGEYTSHGLLANHMYTVLGTSTGADGQLYVKLRDPWGREPNDPNAINGTFYVPISDVLSDCSTVNVGQQSLEGVTGTQSSQSQSQQDGASDLYTAPNQRFSR